MSLGNRINGYTRALLAAALLVSTAGCEGREPDKGWVLTREGIVVPGSAPKVVALDGWVWVDEAHACPPSVAVGPTGELIVTSNVVPTLWRVDRRTLAVTVHTLKLDADADKDVGFSNIVFVPEQQAYLAVSGIQRTLWRIDRNLTTGTKLGRVDVPTCSATERSH